MPVPYVLGPGERCRLAGPLVVLPDLRWLWAWPAGRRWPGGRGLAGPVMAPAGGGCVLRRLVIGYYRQDTGPAAGLL
jgi:hypothetical protein